MPLQPTFKSLEHQGWNERAAVYDAYTGSFTSYAIDPLLAAAEIGPGQLVLDVCCGTGLVAAAAARRRAVVTGIDFAEEMIKAAQAKGLMAEFRMGDAEALPFESGIFDRVVCNFGHYHLPEPDRAILEAARVLRRGGRYAFTTWRGPDASPLFRIIPEVVQAYGTTDVGLPPGPPPFRLADRAESTRVMQAAGFVGIAFADVSAILECPLESVTEFLERATVRVTMLLRAQRPEARACIERTIHERFSDYSDGGMLRLPLPALVISGAKP
jgi:ubiquinone/menaquinone biosynthesis C-methylase UbiE